jgi:4-amino-4-deoxy-L-arabinose transferase-like glycosyltransferase
MTHVKTLFYLLFAIVIAIPIFLNLGKPTLYMWDEATYANNSLEMYLNHDPLVITRNNKPDLYNTKPPLVIWLQVLSIKIFGINEFAIRFPTAIFSLLTCFLLFHFFVIEMNSFFMAISASLILVTSVGFMSPHIAKSGDLDAVLVFWITLSNLIWLRYLLRSEVSNSPPLLSMSIAIIGGVLTKGIAALLFLPFLGIITFFFRKARIIFVSQGFWRMTFLTLLGCVSYYILRELITPGYLKVVWESEILRVAKPVMSWHIEPFTFYLDNFIDGRFRPYIFILPFCLIIPFLTANKNWKHSFLSLFSISVGYFLLISAIKVKLEWYDAPLYPMLAMILAITVQVNIENFNTKVLRSRKQSVYLYSSTLIIIFLFCFPYKKIIDSRMVSDSMKYSWGSSQYDLFRGDGGFIKNISKRFPALKKYYYLKEVPEHEAHYDLIRFYQKMLWNNSNVEIKIINSFQNLPRNSMIAVWNPSLKNYILHSYVVDSVYSWNSGLLFRIQSDTSVHIVDFKPE